MSGREWRKPPPPEPAHRKCGLCGTQWPTERFELVEYARQIEQAAAVTE